MNNLAVLVTPAAGAGYSQSYSPFGGGLGGAAVRPIIAKRLGK